MERASPARRFGPGAAPGSPAPPQQPGRRHRPARVSVTKVRAGDSRKSPPARSAIREEAEEDCEKKRESPGSRHRGACAGAEAANPEQRS